MEHVGDMIEVYNGVEEGTLDEHVSDELEIITFRQEEVLLDFTNVEELGEIDLHDERAETLS